MTPRPAASGTGDHPPPATVDRRTAVRAGALPLVRSLLDDRRVRYLLTGGFTSVVYYGVFSGVWLLSSGRVTYLAVVLLANLVTAVTTYPIYRRVVFRTGGSWPAGFLRFYVTCFWSLVFTLVGMSLLVEVGRLPVLAAQAVLVVVAPVINYQVNRRWAFRDRG